MSNLVPSRLPAGVATSPRGELWGQYGQRNPFNMHEWADDFDNVGTTQPYTKTNTGNGTIAPTAGDGGRLLFTTNSAGAAGSDISSIQLPVASFSLTLGRRVWFGTRLQMSSITNAVLRAGLIQTTVTPGTVTDGIVFEKATGSNSVLQLKHYVGSVATLTLTVPVVALGATSVLSNATDIDIGFYLDDKGYLFAYCGTNVYGFIQSTYDAITRQAVAGGQIPTLTTAVLNATLGMLSGTAASSTMNADFIGAAKERF